MTRDDNRDDNGENHRKEVVAGAPTLETRRVIESLNGPGSARALLKALRPHQWAKNLLLLIPLLLAHKLEWPRIAAAAFAFCSFSLCASAVYVFNDLLDLESDRHHATKRHRPFAAGTLSIPTGLALGSGLLAGALTLAALALPVKFVGMLLLYFALTSSYSLWLKRKMLVDVVMLAALYTHRIIAGAAAVEVPLTMWLLAFSMFFFLSLAFVKRYSELQGLEKAGESAAKGRNYHVTDLRVIEGVGPASGYLSVLVFCNYLDSPLVKTLYRRPQVMWLVCPILLYWVTRIWFFARRGWMHEDPVLFALRDRVSIIAGAAIVAIILIATLPLPAVLGWWPF